MDGDDDDDAGIAGGNVGLKLWSDDDIVVPPSSWWDVS
jgi:hypothetical protein